MSAKQSSTKSNRTQDAAAMSFKHLGISTIFPPQPILSNVSGYIKKGGITAVMGASASGKSLLMKALAGHVQNLITSGEVLIDGVPVDVTDTSNHIGYVPQDDMLIGELTAREMFSYSAHMKTLKSVSEVKEDVNKLLEDLGLSAVADNAIGTVFVRGLSGGQKKRVDIGTELIVAPSILMLDEPTSGLDSSIAFEVLSAIRDIVNKSEGKLSVILSIHQPNSSLLELFDNIMLLGGGGMLFFGTLSQGMQYFTSIGFPPPAEYTPTDYFLQISDINFGTELDFNFEGSFACSSYYNNLMLTLDDIKRKGNSSFTATEEPRDGELEALDSQGLLKQADDQIKVEISLFTRFQKFFKQYFFLTHREFMLAKRDPALYYLQFILVAMFGLMVGMVFHKRKPEIDSTLPTYNGGVLWLVMMMSYVPVFKVYQLTRANARFSHEIANNTYDVLPCFFADLTVTAVMLISFIPGVTFAYFMMDFPKDAFGMIVLITWLTAIAGESQINFICKFSTVTTTNIVMCQCVLVILTVFGGGVFIPWNQMPDYWYWLQEICGITQSSRAALIAVMDELNFKCVLDDNGECKGADGRIYPCDAAPSNGRVCYVKGRSTLHVQQGTSMEMSASEPTIYLLCILICFRLAILFLMYFPVEKLKLYFIQWWYGDSNQRLLNALIGIRRVEGQLVSFISEVHDEREEHMVNFVEHKTMSSGIVDDNSNTLRKKEIYYEKLFTTSPKDLVRPEEGKGSFCLEWTDLTVTLKSASKKVLIQKGSGCARSGRVLALMGPSGAGKTTLLNALGNRAPYAKLTGDIQFGKRQFMSSDLYYVPQFDEVNDVMTIYEQIELVGLLKCQDRKAMHARLHKILNILGLHNRSNVLCNKLTGGELKRVSVGMGMITNPSVLFLDEPTTGLDSSAAYSIVKYIADLAKSTNVTVVMTIHQPSEMVFDMLQDLYLLADGRRAYFGPLAAAKKYFSTMGYECPPGTGLSDFYLELIYKPPKNGNKGWSELYSETVFSSNIKQLNTSIIERSKAAGPALPPPSEFSRFMDLFMFFNRYYVREKGFYFLRVLCLIMIGLFNGTIFLQLGQRTDQLVAYTGAIFFNIWTVFFVCIAATGLMARDQRQAMEYIKNAVMSPASFCLANFVATLPYNFVCALIFQGISHWMTNLNPNGEVFIYVVLLSWGHLLLMESIMYCVVQALKNAMLCTTFGLNVMGSLFSFAGFFITVRDMPSWISWACYIMPTKYSFDGYVYSIFHDQTFDVAHSSDTTSGKELLRDIFKQKDVKMWPMFLVLLAYVALFRLQHYVMLRTEVAPFLQTTNVEEAQPAGSLQKVAQQREEDFV